MKNQRIQFVAVTCPRIWEVLSHTHTHTHTKDLEGSWNLLLHSTQIPDYPWDRHRWQTTSNPVGGTLVTTSNKGDIVCSCCFSKLTAWFEILFRKISQSRLFIKYHSKCLGHNPKLFKIRRNRKMWCMLKSKDNKQRPKKPWLRIWLLKWLRN